jgi:hypothetical protein
MMALTMRTRTNFGLAGIVTFLLACCGLPLCAQYTGDQFPGLTGLKAGSEPGLLAAARKGAIIGGVGRDHGANLAKLSLVLRAA